MISAVPNRDDHLLVSLVFSFIGKDRQQPVGFRGLDSLIRRGLDGLVTSEGCNAADGRDCECSRDSSSRVHPRNILPGSDSLAGEIAQSGERHIVCAIPSFGNWSKTFSFAVTLEAKPSAFKLWHAGEVS